MSVTNALMELREKIGAPIQLYTVAEAARVMGISRQRVCQLHQKDQMPDPFATTARGAPLWEAVSFLAWVAEHKDRAVTRKVVPRWSR